MRIVKTELVLVVLFLFGFCHQTIADPLSESQVLRLKKSVIKVHTSTGKIGTGFIYSSSNYAVTAFHVVAGSTGNVQIEYTAFGSQLYTGKVIRTLKDQDLALIEITNPRTVQPLNMSGENPGFDRVYTSLGYLWDGGDVLPKNLTKKETKQLSSFLPSDARNDIQKAGCPSLNINILVLDENPLVPGYSGAPIFSGDEGVIGIADGGVRQGLASVSWGIPASNLTNLLTSSEDVRGSLVTSQTHFNADVIENANWRSDYFTLGGKRYSKVSTGVLRNIINGTDDVQGLNLIISTFPPQIDHANLPFDIYQNFESGAVLILPAGLQITERGNSISVSTRDQGATLTISAIHIPNNDISQINPLSTQMELSSLRLNQAMGWNWVPDAPFTYALTTSRFDGFLARRKGYKEMFSNYNQFGQIVYHTNNYLFESFIYKNGELLQLVTTNRNYNDLYFQRRFPCDQTGFSASGCAQTLNEIRGWGSLIIATHFGTFSYN